MDPFVACGMRQLADPIYNALLFFFACDAANWGEIFAFRNTSCFWPPLLFSCYTINKYFFKCFDSIKSCLLVLLCMTNKYCFLNGTIFIIPSGVADLAIEIHL